MQKPKTAPLPKRTAEQVLDGFLKNTGGPAYTRISSSLSKGTISTPSGVSGQIEIKVKVPSRFLMRITTEAGETAIGYDGKEGWTRDPNTGLRLLEGGELAQLQLQALQTNAPQSWRSHFKSVELLGMTRSGAIVCYKIRLFPRNGSAPIIQYHDAQTLLLIRSDQVLESPQGKQATVTFAGDYRLVDGVKTAFKMRQRIPETEMLIQLTTVQNNIPLADSEFMRPAEEPTKPHKTG